MARRASAWIVLAALVGSLGLPWFADSHSLNDDPHWAVALRADGGDRAWMGTGDSGDDNHCEVCHWLRTMRSADRVAPTTFRIDVRPQVPPASLHSRTAAASLQSLTARAPPIGMSASFVVS